MLIMHGFVFVFLCRRIKIVVAMVTEIVKLFAKHIDFDITQKVFKLA